MMRNEKLSDYNLIGCLMLIADLRYLDWKDDASKKPSIVYIFYVQMRDLPKREKNPCHEYRLLHLVLLDTKIAQLSNIVVEFPVDWLKPLLP